MEQLDLFGNPLAEEPDYRLKIIYNMPQIKVLDRHMVTLIERQKAEKLFNPQPVVVDKKAEKEKQEKLEAEKKKKELTKMRRESKSP